MNTCTIKNNDKMYRVKGSEIIHDLSDLSLGDVYNSVLSKSIDSVNYYWLGRQDYNESWSLQKRIQDQVINHSLNDIVLFLEHNPVYTLGKNADTSNLLPTKPAYMKVVKTDRGGDITCHAPGQLVGYPIIDLKRHRKSITWFMRGIENSIIDMLKYLDIKSETKEGLTGVWVDNRKVAALGVRLSKWVSMHGFAINVYTDLELFRGIIPCGISNLGLTSIYNIKNRKYDLLQVAELMTTSLANELIRSNRLEYVKV